jgi:hypothetical protein
MNDWGNDDARAARDGEGADFGTEDKIDAKRDLPEDVKPSTAGAGRGGAKDPRRLDTTAAAPSSAPSLDEIELKPASSTPSGASGAPVITEPRGKTGSVLDDPATRRELERTPAPTPEQSAAAQRALAPRIGPAGPRNPAQVQRELAEGQGMLAGDQGFAGRVLSKTAAQGAEALGGVVEAAGDMTGVKAVRDFGANAATNAGHFQAGMGKPRARVDGFGRNGAYLEEQAEGAASSLLNSYSIARAFGAKAVIPLMWAQDSGQEYHAARQAGHSPLEALAIAVPHGAFEAIGEKFTGTDRAMNALRVIFNRGAPKEALKDASAVLLSAGVKEVPGEWITLFGQTAIEQMPGVKVNPNLTTEQFIDQLRDTTVQAAMMGGALGAGGAAAAMRKPGAQLRERSAEEIARDKGFLQREQQIDRLGKAGEKGVADTMKRQLDGERAQAELQGLADKPWGQDPEFQRRYQELRTGGLPPAEAAARAGMASSFQQLAGGVQLDPKHAEKAIEAAAKMPIDKVPGFFDRFLQSLTAKGMVQAPPAGTVGGAIEGIRDDALETQLQAVHGEDVQALTQRITELEAGDANSDRGTAPGGGVSAALGAPGATGAGAAGARSGDSGQGGAAVGLAVQGGDGTGGAGAAGDQGVAPAGGDQAAAVPAADGAAAPVPGAAAGDADQGAAPVAPRGTVDFGTDDGHSNSHHGGAASPQNDLPEPTRAQLLAGNDKKGHIKLAEATPGGALGITIESPAGGERVDLHNEPPKWRTAMAHGYSYGYIKRTVGADDEHVDVFVKDGLPETWAGDVFVVDQFDPATGKFDEHKVIVGADDWTQAKADYLAHYEPGWQGFGGAQRMSMDQFKEWLRDGKRDKPASPQGSWPFTDRKATAPDPAAAAGNRGRGADGGAGTPGADAGEDAAAVGSLSAARDEQSFASPATGERGKKGREKARQAAWDKNSMLPKAAPGWEGGAAAKPPASAPTRVRGQEPEFDPVDLLMAITEPRVTVTKEKDPQLFDAMKAAGLIPTRR